MSIFKHHDINVKFNEKIESILNGISAAANDAEDKSDDINLLKFVSETTTRKMDEAGEYKDNEIIDKFELPDQNDTSKLESLVEIQKTYNEGRNEIIATILKAGVSIVSVLLLLGFEQNHAITSKSLGFMPKPRI